MKKKPFGSCIDLSILRRAWTRNYQRELISDWMFDFAHNIAQNWRLLSLSCYSQSRWVSANITGRSICVSFSLVTPKASSWTFKILWKSWRTLIHRRFLIGAMKQVFFIEKKIIFFTFFLWENFSLLQRYKNHKNVIAQTILRSDSDAHKYVFAELATFLCLKLTFTPTAVPYDRIVSNRFDPHVNET